MGLTLLGCWESTAEGGAGPGVRVHGAASVGDAHSPGRGRWYAPLSRNLPY